MCVCACVRARVCACVRVCALALAVSRLGEGARAHSRPHVASAPDGAARVPPGAACAPITLLLSLDLTLYRYTMTFVVLPEAAWLRQPDCVGVCQIRRVPACRAGEPAGPPADSESTRTDRSGQLCRAGEPRSLPMFACLP